METLNRGPFAHFAALSLVFIALTSCAKRFATTGGEPIPVPPPANFGANKEPIQAKIPAAFGGEIDLADSVEKPLVLIFAQDTCVVCHGETEAIFTQLKNPTIPPSLVRIITVLVGADKAIAADWKNGVDWPWTTGTAVPWEVAYQDDDSLFKSVCPGHPAQVPCLVIQMPGQGLVFQKVGETSIDAIKAVTGPWEVE